MSRVTERLGMPLIAVVGLALLGVPRVVAHDLKLVSPQVNLVLVFAPILVWLGVVWWRRVPNPFLTLLAVGVGYGVVLAMTHQILWTEAFEGAAPELGGNLAGALSPGAEAALFRTFSAGSSLVTGTLVGAVSGVVAWGIARVSGRPASEDR